MVNGFTVPPWIVFPDAKPGTPPFPIAHQAYGDQWVCFLLALTPEGREEYKRQHPEPAGWRGFYDAVRI
jgi:hypothetical protein